MNPADLFRQATHLHRSGQIDEAVKLYEELLAQFPEHGETLQVRGAAELQRGRFEAALGWFDRALAAGPRLAAAHTNRAAALIGLGRYEEALASAKRALELTPASVAAANNAASALNKLGRPAEALEVAARALRHGVEDAQLHIHRAESFLSEHRYKDMLAASERSIELNPNLAEAHGHRGHALSQLGRDDEAAASFARSLALFPESAGGHYAQALALQRSRRFDQAIASCDRALALQPLFPEALIVRAAANETLGRYRDAIADCDKVLGILPDSAEAFMLRGLAFKGANQPERALADLDVALELNPDFPLVPGQRAFISLQICEWDGLEQKIAEVLQALDAGKYAAQPLVMNAFPASAEQQQRLARLAFLSLIRGPRADLRPQQFLDGKLRVAYFSSDFHDHPVGQLIVGLLEAHDRTKFEIIGFGFGGDPNNVTRLRIERACDHFVDVMAKSVPEIVAIARAMNIHIAVDLNGYTAHMRGEIFAQGAAPIQVNFLGFPGTMGTDRIHYIIGDGVVTPPELAPFFDERIVTMPHSYLVSNEIKRNVPSRVSSRRDFGLPEEGFVYCCFNAPFKLTPEAFDVWMRLLKEVNGSILWLGDHGPTATRNLQREAKSRGVGPDRLVFAPRTSGLEYLARYRAADLFLDTFDYNAHATASEALMMGLPVVTRIGNTFAARVGASVLTAIGLPELIATDTNEYEAIARDLGRNATAHKSLREKLRRNAATYPLFDTARYARNLEAAYREMWRRHEAGLAPDHITISEQR
ncbi:MAG: tetratricopeptide repeat protein [Rhodospirillaceae bacterium]